jgi:hypothetical protein
VTGVTKTELKRFEARLDGALERRALRNFDANAALLLAANLAEVQASRDAFGGLSTALNNGIKTFASHLVSGREGTSPDLEVFVEDLMFGHHYGMIREFLYYSYNAPGSLNWRIEPDAVEIRFADQTLPRQFYTVWNEQMLGSRDHFENTGHGDEIVSLLRGRPEFEEGPELAAAEALISAEVDHKLAAYFTILDPNSPIELGGYRYDQAYPVYRHLMIKALYHRYQAEANDEVGLVYIEPKIVEAALSEETGVDRSVIRRILMDLVFDAEAVSDRLDASYFSLMKEGAAPSRIILRPIHFCLSEGLIQLLRVVAQRRPNVFLANVSNPMGSRFVMRLKGAFEAQGFEARAELSVCHIDPGLPDIDLLVISHEPTLGYVFLVCEVKSPLPPLWAKDQLKVLAPDSVSKAFRQAEAIQAFLATPKGIGFIRGLLPDKPLEHFDDFVVIIKSLVITSDNAGMFFGHEETPIINFRTLERLLKRSDGDMLHILECLRHYNDAADTAVGLTPQSFDLDGLRVTYEAANPKGLMDFPQGDWRNSERRESLVADFVAEGHHPFDCLKGRESVLMAFPGSRDDAT